MFHFARFPHRHTIREPSLSSSSSSSTPSTATTSTMAVVNDTKDMTSLNQSAIPQPPLHTEAVWESYGFSKNDVSHVKKGIIRVCFVPSSVTLSHNTHTFLLCCCCLMTNTTVWMGSLVSCSLDQDTRT